MDEVVSADTIMSLPVWDTHNHLDGSAHLSR